MNDGIEKISTLAASLVALVSYYPNWQTKLVLLEAAEMLYRHIDEAERTERMRLQS